MINLAIIQQALEKSAEIGKVGGHHDVLVPTADLRKMAHVLADYTHPVPTRAMVRKWWKPWTWFDSRCPQCGFKEYGG